MKVEKYFTHSFIKPKNDTFEIDSFTFQILSAMLLFSIFVFLSTLKSYYLCACFAEIDETKQLRQNCFLSLPQSPKNWALFF